MRMRTRPRIKNSCPLGGSPNCSRSLMSLTSVSGPLNIQDLGTGHGFLNFSPPFVDQMGRRKYQSAAVAFGVENGCGCNTNDRVG